MSLKTFHLFFILIAALFCGAFGVWATFLTTPVDGFTAKIFGTLSLLASLTLFVYSIYFYRKAKNFRV